jgi:uncharacterized OsmC-like protein
MTLGKWAMLRISLGACTAIAAASYAPKRMEVDHG